jgi:Tfp pilus tip-associated adhesin PilY1
MAIGRVLIGGNETWVGFIGGGYNSTAGDTRGRGFFVVRLSDGNILWSYTKANSANMTYSIPAAPEIVDWDGDGFIDTAYVGDLGGNIWRFTFCTNVQGSSCGTGNWSGGKLFNSAGVVRPIYKKVTLARDSASLWVFWGTGDQESPQLTSTSDAFFAVKDIDRSTTGYTISNLQSATYTDSSKAGWYYTFDNAHGEKMLFDPTVFGGIVLFTSYTPPLAGHAVCDTAGTSALYAMAMMKLTIGGTTYGPGGGVLASGAKSQNLGQGMAQTPVFSQRPTGSGTDLYLNLSGDPGHTVLTNSTFAGTPLAVRLAQTAPSSQVIHWRDGRIQ